MVATGGFMEINIEDLRWHRIKVLFKNRNDSTILVSVLHAIFEGAYIDSFPDLHEHGEDPAPLVFHPDRMKFNHRLKVNELFQVTILLCRHSMSDVFKFCEELERRMKIPENAALYFIDRIISVEERNPGILRKESGDIPGSGSISLNFLLPYNKRGMKAKDAKSLKKIDFIKDFEKRFTKLFGMELKYFSENDDFEVDSSGWNYTDVAKRNSKSKPGTHYINGFAGKLTIKGVFNDFLPFILLGSELHAGAKITFGLGYYVVCQKP